MDESGHTFSRLDRLDSMSSASLSTAPHTGHLFEDRADGMFKAKVLARNRPSSRAVPVQLAAAVPDPHQGVRGHPDACGPALRQLSGNKFNPDPNVWVYSGDQAWEEMMSPFTRFVIDADVDERELTDRPARPRAPEKQGPRPDYRANCSTPRSDDSTSLLSDSAITLSPPSKRVYVFSNVMVRQAARVHPSAGPAVMICPESA